MKLNLSLVKNDECEKILGYKTRKLPISSQICATGEQFKSDSCSGDSGGPLMAFNKRSGQTEVIGIVSIGIRILKIIGWLRQGVTNESPSSHANLTLFRPFD